MRRILCASVLLIMGCSASAATTKSAEQLAIEDLDAAFTAHVEATALPRSVATQAGFKEQLQQKLESLKELERAYQDFRESDEDVVAAHAAKRMGQLYLNASCEVATLELTVIDNPSVKPAAQEALEDAARPIFDRARGFFAEAAELRDGGEHATVSKSIAETMREPQIEPVCVATATHWEASNRPDAAPAVLGVLKMSCDDKFTMLNTTATPECFAKFKERCEAQEANGCAQLGRHHYFAGAFEASYEAFKTACDLGGDCIAAEALSVASRKNAYAAACSDESALGCFQMARLVDSADAPTFQQCSATRVPQAKDVAKKCAAGDAASCWARAGALAIKGPIQLPKPSAGLLGGLGMRGKSNETPEQRRTRLTQECREEKTWSCIGLASMMKEAGEDPTETFRDACKHGRAGCDELANHLLDQGGKAQVAEAVELLTKNCAADWWSSCGTAAKLFVEGKDVPKSPTCAASLSWRMCRPTATWDCSYVNRIFGHKPAN